MSNAVTLLPTTIALSGDSAIESILADIPLFCEGIMGIGVFTFLFLTKQVKLLSMFLYGSSLLAFAAATLDLSQVLARGRSNAAKGIGLNDVLGLIFAREIFLALSLASLNLFFWTLVAQCPRGERPAVKSDLPMDNRRGMSLHSASWSRWGYFGTILKWGSLGALLSVPLLHVLWIFLPAQRKYAAIYVAESTLQTTLLAVFILKLLLNIYISPVGPSWNAFGANFAPISALVIGLGIGVGNLILFSFSETCLGRFLRAAEVYILILHNLYATFEDIVASHQNSQSNNTTTPLQTQPSVKLESKGNLVPSYDNLGYIIPQQRATASEALLRVQRSSRGSNFLPWNMPRRSSTPTQFIQSDSRDRVVEVINPSNIFTSATREMESMEPRKFRSESQSSMTPSFTTDDRGLEKNVDRPSTAVSLSYYTMQAPSPEIPRMNLPEPQLPSSDYSKGNNGRGTQSSPRASRDPTRPTSNSQQGSITSLDELFRQQSELDKSIAALRLYSQTEFSTVPSSVPTERANGKMSIAANPSRSTLTNSYLTTNKTESISGHSEFSLSVFPNPPVVPKNEVATKYTVDGRHGEGDLTPVMQKPPRKEIAPISIALKNSSTPSSPIQFEVGEGFNSARTQYDVTSFIGDLTGPRGSGVVMTPDGLESEAVETPVVTAVASSPLVLRPMILASSILTGMSQPEYSAPPTLSATTYNAANTSLPTTPENSAPLRPFFLGKPALQMTQQLPGTMVPLAQRRKRGGSINTARRPIISIPQSNRDGEDPEPGAFERPRPPPLRLNPER
ncbi:hypothetical protein B0H34DRAFT_683800 [Crassisporium funariophilum]|nr:hypothetical protein B0H34DRAFT_683800 [Crassisporium funariophilum]